MNIIKKVIEELTNIREKIDQIEQKNKALQLSNDNLINEIKSLKHSAHIADNAATMIIKEQDNEINKLLAKIDRIQF